MKKFSVTAVATLYFIFSPFTVMADTAADQLKQLLTGFQNMQASFEQSVLDGHGGSLQSSTGEMALQRPGKFRWDVRKPFKQLIIADGRYLWIYDVDLEQITRKKQNIHNNASPAMLLSNNTESLIQNFRISQISKSGAEGQWFKLEPNDENSLFQSVQLHFKNGKLAEMQLVSALGQRSILKFYHVNINSPLAPDFFRFRPPDNVDVIRE